MPTTTAKKPKTYGLNKDILMRAHREDKSLWKWELSDRIRERYQIPCARLQEFHELYGLPKLSQSGSTSIFNAMYSLPGLELILQTVSELHE